MVSEPRFLISGLFEYFFSLGFVGFSCSAHSGFHLGGVLLFSALSTGVRFLLLFPVPFRCWLSVIYNFRRLVHHVIG